ncbi:hypothetical protein H5410_057249 [Solanum commersonii]|uniref:Non-haem dioxygenase N-terminal domain-containing protein n=1 Tax=Solanum commersonii TaxID=4109 RepID=A0A9J5WME8_SOLCO|nr:hypothetical protein H5410_057249 [Solanum commersonii]
MLKNQFKKQQASGVLEDLKDATHKFFELPAEEKVKYYKESYSAGESVLMFWSAISDKNEKVLEWRDSIKHGCNAENDSNLWPSQTRTSLDGNYGYQHKLLSTMPKSKYYHWGSPTLRCLLHYFALPGRHGRPICLRD